MPRSRDKPRSELEGFVLGLVWQLGPCSPYEIRRHLQNSPSSQWSASAGAIYPLLRRLEALGLVRSKARRTGKRERREYELTARGLSSLRTWVGPPMAESAVTVAHDPLRSRARFLGALAPADRAAWLASARAALDEVERRVRAWDEAFGQGPGASAMTASGELDVRSRREWLDVVEKGTT
jgi:DNA-binding PadR family transcriptional regulator